MGGLALAVGNPVTNKLVALHVLPAARGLVMGIKQSGVQIGAFLAGMLLPALAGVLGWRWALGAAALAAGVSGAAALMAVPPAGARTAAAAGTARLRADERIRWLVAAMHASASRPWGSPAGPSPPGSRGSTAWARSARRGWGFRAAAGSRLRPATRGCHGSREGPSARALHASSRGRRVAGDDVRPARDRLRHEQCELDRSEPDDVNRIRPAQPSEPRMSSRISLAARAR